MAARLEFGHGEVILVSDPSILINSMVRKDDNRAFPGYPTGGIEPGGILVDQLHLEKGPLDHSRLMLVGTSFAPTACPGLDSGDIRRPIKILALERRDRQRPCRGSNSEPTA